MAIDPRVQENLIDSNDDFYPTLNAFSLQNIRINVPSTFTVGVSTNPLIMNNAAERSSPHKERY